MTLVTALLLFIHHERELDIPIAKMEHFKLPLDLNIMILFLLALTGLHIYREFNNFICPIKAQSVSSPSLPMKSARKYTWPSLGVIFKDHGHFQTTFSSILILLTLLLGSVSYLEYYNRSFITTEYLAQFDASIVHYNETGNSTQVIY